jgi:photosystem II stability/assembly factor-like uncharacterized protein
VRKKDCLTAAILLALAGCAGGSARGTGAAPAGPIMQEQTSGTRALLQAVSAVNDRVAWVSGHSATFARTVDGGRTWQAGRVPGADTTLQFRDVYALDADNAWLMSAGNGPASRIYRTSDGGKSWTLQFTNSDQRAFYDCMDFWDGRHGVAVSDAVEGKLVILVTTDGGAHWTHPPTMPDAYEGEGGFAASGTCLVTRPGGQAWIGTGNGPRARVLHSVDHGWTWAADSTPLPSGNATGITSVSFRDARNGLAFGGNVGDNNARGDVVVATHDAGATWAPGGRPPFSGAIFGGAYVPGARVPTAVAVGPKGSAWSRDDGATWTSLDTLAYWAVGFASPRAGWAVGPRGRIVKLSGF